MEYMTFESCVWSGRQPGNEAISTLVIYSESEEAAASSASMLGTPMAFTLCSPKRQTLLLWNWIGNVELFPFNWGLWKGHCTLVSRERWAIPLWYKIDIYHGTLHYQGNNDWLMGNYAATQWLMGNYAGNHEYTYVHLVHLWQIHNRCSAHAVKESLRFHSHSQLSGC